MRIRETKVYSFDELSEDAKQTALGKLSDINVCYEWWDAISEDATRIGLSITEFEFDGGRDCRGDFCKSYEDVAKMILQEHGKECETYKTAKEFLVSSAKAKDDEVVGLEVEFRQSLLEDYRIILQKEYEYLTSEDAVIETIEANEYEFTEDGKIF